MQNFSSLSRPVMILAETDVEAGDFIVTDNDGAGYATDSAPAGDLVEIETGGIFSEEVLSEDDIEIGAPIYFTNGSFSSTGDVMVGRAYDPAVAEDGIAYVTFKLGA